MKKRYLATFSIMSARFLLHFAHEHINFRWTEFLALTLKNKCSFKLISEEEHLRTRPFIIIELEDGVPQERLIKTVQGSYLLKGLFELWSRSSTSLEDLAIQASRSIYFTSKEYHNKDQSFRVNCESFGTKLPQHKKVEWIQKMLFLEEFQCRPNLSNPKQIYCIFEMNTRKDLQSPYIKEYYFGRQITEGDRDAIHKFNLKDRRFIANTSMDPMLSLIAANAAKVEPNGFVYDPFVGSGGLLVAAAYKGSFVLGGDIDWPLLHGKSRPSRKGVKIREEGESVRANLMQYNLGNLYLDVLISDITRSPFGDGVIFDSIITDPPYGIRECSEKVGSKSNRKPVVDHRVHYPSKVNYCMDELLSDLLNLAARHLKIYGRLVYFLPLAKATGDIEKCIPSHPCLKIISYCVQLLTVKTLRVMIVMEKLKPSNGEERAFVPQSISTMNFRETYFGHSEEKEDE